MVGLWPAGTRLSGARGSTRSRSRRCGSNSSTIASATTTSFAWLLTNGFTRTGGSTARRVPASQTRSPSRAPWRRTPWRPRIRVSVPRARASDSAQVPCQSRLIRPWRAVKQEDVLCQIRTDDGNLGHGCFLLPRWLCTHHPGALRCRREGASAPSPTKARQTA